MYIVLLPYQKKWGHIRKIVLLESGKGPLFQVQLNTTEMHLLVTFLEFRLPTFSPTKMSLYRRYIITVLLSRQPASDTTNLRRLHILLQKIKRDYIRPPATLNKNCTCTGTSTKKCSQHLVAKYTLHNETCENNPLSKVWSSDRHYVLKHCLIWHTSSQYNSKQRPPLYKHHILNASRVVFSHTLYEVYKSGNFLCIVLYIVLLSFCNIQKYHTKSLAIMCVA